MSATVANDQFATQLHAIPSYIDASEEQKPAAVRAPGRSLAQRVAAGLAWFAEYRARRALIAEMASMSDRELADIGLGRADIARVFTADFRQDNTLARRAA